VRFLSSALATGRIHLAGPDGDAPLEKREAFGWRQELVGSGTKTSHVWRPQGKCVGWANEQYVFLDPPAALAEVQRFATEQGLAISVSEHTLSKMLNARGLLAVTAKQRGTLTIRRMIHGDRRSVLCLFPEVVFTGTNDLPNVPTDQQSDDGATTCAGQVDDFQLPNAYPATAHEHALPSQQSNGRHHADAEWDDPHDPGQVNGHTGQVGGQLNTTCLPTENAVITEQESALGSLGSEMAQQDTSLEKDEHEVYYFDGR
jgi:hypothetical protein